MGELLWQIDSSLFLLINHLPHNFFLDLFFGFVTGIGYGGAVWFLIGSAFFILEKKKDKKTLFALFIAGILSIFLNELGIKNIVRRLRPQYKIPEVVLPFGIARSFSFPSGHATMAFAAAFIFSQKHKKWAWVYYLLAVIVAFSRIYLGNHYPSDVLAGMLVGTLIGYCSIKIVKKAENKQKK